MVLEDYKVDVLHKIVQMADERAEKDGNAGLGSVSTSVIKDLFGWEKIDWGKYKNEGLDQ